VYDCPQCHDIGYLHPLADGKVDYSSTIPCQCRAEEIEKERTERILRLCELPYGSDNLRFETFKAHNDSLRAALKYARELADETTELKWLTLIGDVDVGKTHLALAICRKWLERKKPARYVFVPMILDQLRRGYSKQGENSFDSQMEFLMNVHLLVLDDLGAQKQKDREDGSWAIEKLETIIDYRYINGLPLVVTANVPVDDFSFRIASRLRRFEAGKIILIDAEEFRKVRK